VPPISTTIAALCLTLSAHAFAQDDDRSQRARRFFERGAAASRAGDTREAVEEFERSYEILPLPGTLLNLAVLFDDADRRIEALSAWRELLERFGGEISEDARSRTRDCIRALEDLLASVRIIVEPRDAHLYVDERATELPSDRILYLEPGQYVFVARLGDNEMSSTVDLVAGRNPSVSLRLDTNRPDLFGDPAENDLGRMRAGRLSGSVWGRPWPWVVSGGVLAAILTTVIIVVAATAQAGERSADWRVALP